MSEPIEPVTPEIDPEKAAAEEAATKAGKRLTREQWLEIEDHVAFNTKSGRDICKEYGISSRGFSSHFERRMKDGVFIGRGSKRHLLSGKVAAAVVAGVATTTTSAIIGAFAAKRKERIEQTKTSLFQQSQIIQSLLNMVLKDVADTTKPDATAASMTDHFKALQRAEAINASMVKTRWILLDVENDIDEATMPKLIFEDLTQAEIDAMQSAGGEDEDEGLDFDVTEDDAAASEIVEEGGD